MVRRRIAALGLTFALASLPAAAVAPELAAPAWTVVKPESTLGFSGVSSGSPFDGQFNAWNASIHFDPDNLAHSMAEVTIDVASAETGDPGKDQSMAEPDWFSATLFPTATFRTDSITHTGDNLYVADGTLTIRDVSAPVSLPFSLTIEGSVAKMEGSVTIDRSTFGVGQGAWASGSSVGLDIAVNLSVTAVRAD